MKFLDYFYYLTYKFAHSCLKKNEDDSKWSAFLFTSLYLVVFFAINISILGLIINNPLSNLFKTSNLVSWFVLWVASPLILGFRYSKKTIVDRIERQFLIKSKSNQIIISWIVIILILILPVLLFFVYRLYVFGNNW